MTAIETIASQNTLPRAEGSLRLAARSRNGATRIMTLRQAGSSKLLFPKARSARLTGVVVNTAGGIAGGDRFRTSVALESGSIVTLTSQAAERIYLSRDGTPARVTVDARIAEGARLNWLPNETIFFDGGALERRFTCDLAPGGSLLYVEPLVFGRAAMGETVRSGHLTDRVMIRREGSPVFADTLGLRGDIAHHLDGPATGGGAQAAAQLLYIAPDAERWIDPVRALLPETAGASLIGADILTVRILARTGKSLRESLMTLIRCLDTNNLPATWTH